MYAKVVYASDPNWLSSQVASTTTNDTTFTFPSSSSNAPDPSILQTSEKLNPVMIIQSVAIANVTDVAVL